MEASHHDNPADSFRPAPESQADWVVVDDEGRDEMYESIARSSREDGDHLDALRVRQLSAVRRGAYRTRSYCVIGLGVCAVAAVQLVVMAVRHVRAAGWEWRPVGYLCGVAAAMMAAAFLSRQVAELTRELRRPALAEPEAPPDLSTLSDGSQHWKNLENMQRRT
jgi:hypothetical protein